MNQQRLEQQPEGSSVDSTSPQLKKKRPNLINESIAAGHTILEDSSSILQEDQTSTTKGTVSDINLQLMQEQRLRLRLEERVKSLERQLSMSSQHLRPASNINPTPQAIVANGEPEQTITILTSAGGNENMQPSTDQLLSRSNPLPPNLTSARLPTAPQPPPTAILLQAAASAATPSAIPVTSKVNISPVPSQITVAMAGPPNTQAVCPTLPTEKSMVAVPASVLQAAMAATKKDGDAPSQTQQLQRVEMERLPTLQPSLPPPTLPSVPLPRQSPQHQSQTVLARGTTLIKLDTSGNELRDGKPIVASSNTIAISGERRYVL